MTDYNALFAACLEEMDRPLPKNCKQRGWPQSQECQLAGGCPVCYAEILPSGRRKKDLSNGERKA